MTRSDKRTLAVVFGGLVAFLLLALVYLSQYGAPQWYLRRVCRHNMENLYANMLTYAGEHHGIFPSRCSALLSTGYCVVPTRFVCAATRKEPGPSEDVDHWTAYVLCPRTLRDPPLAVLAFCPPNNHWGRAAHVLRVDGTLEAMSAMEFTRLLRSPVLFCGTADGKLIRDMQKRDADAGLDVSAGIAFGSGGGDGHSAGAEEATAGEP